MSYIRRVKITRDAMKQLMRMDGKMASRIRAALLRYESERIGDVRKLQGRDGYRLRIGGYRAIFEMDGREVILLEAGPRGDVYK